MIGNWWGSEDPLVSVKILAWISDTNDMLKVTSFYWLFTDDFNPITYPKFALEMLDTPDQIWVYLAPTEQADVGSYTIVLYYRLGFAFRYRGRLLLTYENESGTDEQRFLSLCAGAESATVYSAEVYLFDTQPGDTKQSNPFPEELLRWVIIAPQPFVPLEEALSISVSDFTQAILEDENGCLTASWPMPSR